MFNQEPKFNEKLENVNIKSFLDSLLRADAIVSPEDNIKDSYRLIFSFENDFTVTMKINFEGDDKKELVITNMTTLPETDKGFGSKAVQMLIDNAKESFSRIMAVQINDPRSESFWVKNGFVKCAGENPCNDFELKLI